MERQRWLLIQSLFHKYVDLPAAGRRAGLEAHHPDDPSLVDEVLAMCAAADRSAAETAPDVAGLMMSLLGDLQDPYLGRSLGPYRLDELLGHGGMGRVYKATRLDYGGVVALKILYERIPVDPALHTQTLTAEAQNTIAQARRERFLLEEKTLAKLSHPAIAQLKDAGAEPDGTLYFVMEYVEGTTLFEYCQKKHLSLRERLHLFRMVCAAVQYAHQQAVIHRDLKPSNILVTDAGEVKLLDFGISESAHAPSLEIGERTSGYMTLSYAAPEQVRHAPSAVQADVYALGVILQQLVTNQLLFDFKGKDTEEIRRIILEVPPPLPSSVAPAHFASKSEWHDLDALCGKALRKDPVERYGSVEAFASDVDRFLRLRPLVSRQPHTAPYRLSRFVKRNRTSLALATAAAAVLITLVSFYTYRLRISRDEALSEAQRAKDVQAFVVGLFKGFDSQSERVSIASAEAILGRGEREARTLQRQPLVQAAIFDALGSGFDNLGQFDHADKLYRTALALREQSFGKSAPGTVENLLELANVQDEMSRFDQAEQLGRKALAIAQGEKPNDPSRFAKTEIALGNVLADIGKNQEAFRLFENSLHLCTTEKLDLDTREDTEIGLSIAENNLGHPEKARAHNRESLRIARQLKGDDHPDVADNLLTANDLHSQAGLYADAEQDARKALRILDEWLGPEHHKTVEARRVLAQDLNSLGKYAEAEKMLQQALAADQHARPEPHRELGLLLNALAMAQGERSEWELAESNYLQALAVYRSLYHGRDYKIAITLSNLASLDYKRHKFPQAEKEEREALDMFHQTLPPDHPRATMAEAWLGRILAAERKYTEAEAVMLASYGKFQKQKFAPADSVANARHNLYQLYRRLGEPDKARAFADPLKQ